MVAMLRGLQSLALAQQLLKVCQKIKVGGVQSLPTLLQVKPSLGDALRKRRVASLTAAEFGMGWVFFMHFCLCRYIWAVVVSDRGCFLYAPGTFF